MNIGEVLRGWLHAFLRAGLEELPSTHVVPPVSLRERRAGELVALCHERGWALAREDRADKGYTTFKRHHGQSTIGFEVDDHGWIKIKFLRPEEVTGLWGAWRLHRHGQEGPTNYWVVMASEATAASVSGLLPLLQRGWDRLSEAP